MYVDSGITIAVVTRERAPSCTADRGLPVESGVHGTGYDAGAPGTLGKVYVHRPYLHLPSQSHHPIPGRLINYDELYREYRCGYLQSDGAWGNKVHYFSSVEAARAAVQVELEAHYSCTPGATSNP